MKLLAFSDSHGKAREVRRMLKKAEAGGKPDMVLFAGDGVHDALDLRYEGYLVRAVRGNCDLGAPPDIREEMTLKLNGIGIYIAHGHRFHGLEQFWARAQEVGAKLAIFGHTHEQTLEAREGILLLNPGALKNGEYAVINIDDEGGIDILIFD